MSKGLYAAYFTGEAGISMGLFLIGDGIIAGADGGGMKYDGTLAENPDGSLEGEVKYTVFPGLQLVTGNPINETQEIVVSLRFPNGLDTERDALIETPLGPVNARFKLIREGL